MGLSYSGLGDIKWIFSRYCGYGDSEILLPLKGYKSSEA
jgi:hypothetical protein